MPEGDTIFRTAETLHRVLAGKRVTRFESVFPSLTRVDEDHPVAGRLVESVGSRGKHLLVHFSDDLVLHTHMRMNGSWHTYPAGEQWRRSSRDMRIVIATEDAVAVGFNIPVAELLTARQLARHPQLLALGPDLLDRAFDRAEARQRMRACGGDAIGDALLNQRVLSGIGNMFKSEILFVAQVDPFTRVQDLSDDTLERILDVALAQLRANVASGAEALARAGAWRGRRTTGSLHPDKGLWVYGRGGLPCRKCGTTVVAKKTGVDARLTYSCPRCQPAGGVVSRAG